MNPRALVGVATFLLLVVAPVRLGRVGLMRLALALWLAVGGMLIVAGLLRIHAAGVPWLSPVLLLGLAAAAVAGWLKARFVLVPAARRNRERIAAFDGPRRPVQVYGARTWLLVGGFMLLGMALRGHGPWWLGLVTIAVGVGLAGASLVYLDGPRPPPAA